MIKITNINIKFDRSIIENSSINIPTGKITAITGESGSGKSTVLYLLGLLSSNKNYKYNYFDKTLNLNDERVKSKIRREDFGFLFQDNSLIDNLTVAENIRYLSHLSGHQISNNEINDLLKKVDLKIDAYNTFPKQLSGGEQQRAALACILAKKPKVIFADEPTSSLDKPNTKKIIDIFKQLSQIGITIVIATHSDDICNCANTVYRIVDKSLQLEKQNLNQSKSNNPLIKTKRDYNYGIKDMLKYIHNSQRKNKLIKGIITVFCAIAITGFSITNNVLDKLSSMQSALINQISNRELFVVSQSRLENDVRDYDGNISISNEDYIKICNLEGIAEVYPYYEFRSFSLVPENRVLGTSVNITTNIGNSKIDFSIDSPYYPYFIIMPYNSNQKLDQQIDYKYNKSDNLDDIYISHELAESLNLINNNINEVKMSFNIGIPVKKFENPIVDESTTSPYEDLDISEFREMNLSISGILNDNVLNRYSINGNRYILMPQNMMDKILDNTIKECSNKEYDEIKSKYTVKEWFPSAYIIYTQSYNGISLVKSKIENINSKFATRYDYQDTVAMEKLIVNVKSTANIILVILLGIIFVLMSSLFISATVARKREISILKANGMSNFHLIMLMVFESLNQGLKIIIIATLISFILSMIASLLLLATLFLFSFRMIALISIISIIFVLFPTIVSVIFTLRIEPDRILRN